MTSAFPRRVSVAMPSADKKKKALAKKEAEKRRVQKKGRPDVTSKECEVNGHGETPGGCPDTVEHLGDCGDAAASAVNENSQFSTRDEDFFGERQIVPD